MLGSFLGSDVKVADLARVAGVERAPAFLWFDVNAARKRLSNYEQYLDYSKKRADF